MLESMKLIRLVLILMILVVVGIACASIAGFMNQSEAINIGGRTVAILGIVGLGLFAIKVLVGGKK